jgi:integrase
MNQYIEKYTYPKLCTRSGDVTKQWYVYFFWTEDEVKKQIRVKRGLNLVKNKKDRELEAKYLLKAVVKDLENGWNPITDKVEKQENRTVSEAINAILELKRSTITARSYKTYKDEINLFVKWLVLKHYDKLFIHNFTDVHARQYFDYLLLVRKHCGKTFNGHRANLNVFFNALVDRKEIKSSPIKGIKKRPEERGKNTTFSKEDEAKFIEYTKKNDIDFYYATRFIKYCFFRRSELVGIKVKNINWENKTIVVDSEIAKGNRQESITISKSLEKIILEMGIIELDPEWYIFSGCRGCFTSGPTKKKRVDDFTDKQNEINKILGINQGTFYSWKHTGTVELYNSMKVKDVYVVSRQCRHTDIKMTMIYLRSLGMGVSEEVRAW